MDDFEKIKVGNRIVFKQTQELPLMIRALCKDIEDFDKYFAGRMFTVSTVTNTDFGISIEVEEDENIPEKLLNDDCVGKKVHKFAEVYIKHIIPDEFTDLSQTIALMESPSYKDRFMAEYYQLKIRKDKLQNMYDNWDNLNFVPTCDKSTYKTQLLLMCGYLEVLSERAEKEGIKLC